MLLMMFSIKDCIKNAFVFFIILFSYSSFNVVLAAPSIDVNSITTNYPSSSVPKYEKFEITFDVATTAFNPQFPYDASPPPGVNPEEGVSVDAVFTDPDGNTFQQPAYYQQEFDYQVKSNKDWLYPLSQYHWKVRFAPNKLGTWQYLLTVNDKDGSYTTPTNQSFEVVDSNSKGFIKVSETDSRYFEFEDGTYFPALGLNVEYGNFDWRNPIQTNESLFQKFEDNKIQFIRTWITQWNIFGANWPQWKSHLNNDAINLTINNPYPGHDLSAVINGAPSGSRCLMWGWNAFSLPVKRNTQY